MRNVHFPTLPHLPRSGRGALLAFPGAILLTGLGVVGWTLRVGFKVGACGCGGGRVSVQLCLCACACVPACVCLCICGV